MENNILFLTLKVFSATGGIEKVCRVAGKSLYEYSLRTDSLAQVYCMHDRQEDADDNRYFPSEMFRGFGKQRMNFIRQSIRQGRKCHTVVISHINLLLVGWMIKKLSPKTRIVMFAHGIEIWGDLPPYRKMMMNCCDQILSVSQFTSDRIHSQHQVPSPVLKVLNNCLDPFLPVGFSREPEQALRDKYGFTKDDTILFTLTRLSSKERYKGYDKVLQALVELKKTHHRIRYLLAGSYDAEEKRHLDDMINNMGLAEYVRVPGFISDDELVSHFSIADIYVMPSMKEGFGIVFIEAMYYGLPVIAGNKDGSVDALLNGELGILVDPMDPEAIRKAIQAIMEQGDKYLPDRKKLMDHFSYDQYKNKFENLIGAENLQQ